MIARLYSNENFPLPVVEALRGFGHDVLSPVRFQQRERGGGD
jgi:hypothetical protein